ncbi:MAG: adenylate/guanylate cyclase domain-containing protein [Kovacikia sp.]
MTLFSPRKNSKWRLSLAVFGPWLVGFWAISSAVVTVLNPDLLRSLDLRAQGLFFRLRGPVAQPDSIVILAMDEDSLTQGANFKQVKEFEPIRTWPWSRAAYATAIEKVMAAGAKAVAVDIVFDSPSDRPEADQRLQKVLQRYRGRVTLAAMHTSSLSGGGGLDQLVYPDPMFQTTPGSIGFINYLLEPGGQYRRFAWSYLKEKINSDLLQSQPEAISFPEAALKVANVPFSSPKGDYIFFYGGQYTFSTISFLDVLSPENWQVRQQQQIFKDKIVLIGPTAAFFNDFHPTPFGRIPGVEIHANEIATLLENRAIAEAIPSPIGRGIFVFLEIAASGLIAVRLAKRAIPRSLLALGLAAAWTGVSYFSFVQAGLILPVAIPALAIALSGLSFLGTGAISNLLEKLRLRRTLERYVSPSIVQQILSQPENYEALLQGQKLKAAVLFCDIRDFTCLSYKLPADQLVAQLNTYLNAMVEAISSLNGTIDKFIGDAIMAEFGSPVSQGEENDAMNAIRAALGMRQALAELRQQWQREGKTLLYHGIGISYGEVIAGNIGSLQRLEYTVIGDAVNVASRIEGLTKNFYTDILIPGSLYERVQDQVEVVSLGEHQLRGREDLTHLYSLVGLKGEDTTLYQQVHEELRQYLDTRKLQES